MLEACFKANRNPKNACALRFLEKSQHWTIFNRILKTRTRINYQVNNTDKIKIIFRKAPEIPSLLALTRVST